MVKISVIITTFGGDIRLRRAIYSVLEQTYSSYEIIVVDDNEPSSKARLKTEKIMSEFKGNNLVVYLKHDKNYNGSYARNTGIEHSKGEYISFLDDDDFYIDNRFEKILEYINSNVEIIGVCTGTVEMCSGYVTNENVQTQGTLLTPKMLLLNQGAIGTGSNIFVRSEIIKRIGGFDTSFNRFQDVEFMIRASEEGKILFVEDLLVVKDVTDARIPNYNRVFSSLELFQSKFKKEINDMSEAELQTYYSDRKESLLYLAKQSLDKHNLIQAISYNNQKPSLKEEAGVFLYCPYIIVLKNIIKQSKFFSVIKKIQVKKRKKRNSELIQINSQFTKKFFYKYIYSEI